MTRKVVAVPPSLLISHAWEVMQRERIRHLPVVANGKVVGILSDRDLLRIASVLPSGDLAFVRRHVEDIMTLKPITCAPGNSVAYVAQIMTQKTIDAIPIVDDDRLVGLVTSTDLLHLLVEGSEKRLPFEFNVDLIGALS
jgi:acetoin utilization protein AcuB